MSYHDTKCRRRSLTKHKGKIIRVNSYVGPLNKEGRFVLKRMAIYDQSGNNFVDKIDHICVPSRTLKSLGIKEGDHIVATMEVSKNTYSCEGKKDSLYLTPTKNCRRATVEEVKAAKEFYNTKQIKNSIFWLTQIIESFYF